MRNLVFRKIFHLIAFGAILSIALTSCGTGSNSTSDADKLGEVETRTLSLDADFNGINVSGAFKVVYVAGENCAVEVTTRTQVFDMLKYNVNNGKLNVGLKSRSNSNIGTILLTIQAPELEYISMSGACKFSSDEELRAEAMSLNASGASSISIKGASADRMRLKLSGASKFIINSLELNYLGMSLSGASSITMEDLNVNNLKMSASGASKVKLAGCAKETVIDVSGASVINMEEFESAKLITDVSGASTIRQ